MAWFAATLFGAICFLFGRVFNQSEAILSEKRRVYEAFLKCCPSPNQAYLDARDPHLLKTMELLEIEKSSLLIYASESVFMAVSRYLETFSSVASELDLASPALHPSFVKLAKAHNDVVLEMRRDALAWSVFGFSGKRRF